MGFINKYPYTDFHELNLDWLLENYKNLVDSLAEINAWISTHQTEYDEAIKRLTYLENEVNTFEARVNAEFAQLQADLENDLNNAISAMNREIDLKLRRLQNELETAIQDMKEYYEQLEVKFANEFAQLRAQIMREIMDIRNEVTANNELVFNWVQNAFEEFIHSLPEILTVEVYNPYRGEVTDIQTAIDDIYTVACIWGLTAQQYDDLGLTATEYDNKELTAVEYDTMGYKLLYKDPDYYMISPFTGELTPVKDVVLRLAYFHMEGLTASEYDAKDITASDYDALQLTAFDYDWFGEQLIA